MEMPQAFLSVRYPNRYSLDSRHGRIEKNMTRYLVCYTIPEEPSQDDVYRRLMDFILAEARSEDYRPIYEKLNEIGRRILTSTYLVDYQGTANDLLRHVLIGLTNDLKKRIKILVSEISTNRAYHPPRRRARTRRNSG
jgi:hypothetical protein